LAGPADERAALAVFIFARGLADERDPRPGVALAGDGIRPRLGQLALLALGDLCGDAGQARFGVGSWLGVACPKGSGGGGIGLDGLRVGRRIFGCRRGLTPDGKISDELAIDLKQLLGDILFACIHGFIPNGPWHYSTNLLSKEDLSRAGGYGFPLSRE
jgi:hypothetical protein